MVGVKYYDAILRAQKRTRADPASGSAEFRFQDHEDHSLQARILQWVFEHPRLLAWFLRRFIPVLRIGRFALVTRYSDVREVLDRDDIFEAPFGLEMTEVVRGANFVLGMPRGAEYDRMKRHMHAAFHADDPERIVAPLARNISERILRDARGHPLNAARDYITRVSTGVVGAYFGVPISDEAAFADWATAISFLCFADPLGVPKTRRIALAGAERLRVALDAAISRAKAGGSGDTIVDRLVRQQADDPDGPTDAEVRGILMGTITGLIPTIGVAGPHMLKVLLDRAEAMEPARLAALDRNDDQLWSCLVEAMRFLPLNPGPYRYALADFRLADSRRIIREGTTVLASTQSAMLDSRRVEHPDEFRPGRPIDANLLFGQGLHRCFGIAIAKALLTATFGALLREPALRPVGTLKRLGPFPTELLVEYGPKTASAAVPEVSMITVCVPLAKEVRIDGARAVLDQLGNPARQDVSRSLDRSGRIHFLSMHVLDPDPVTGAAHFVLETTADGDAGEVLHELAQVLEQPLGAILKGARGLDSATSLADFLVAHRLSVGYALGRTSGLDFCGTPGLSVQRILRERELERAAADALQRAATPHDRQSLVVIERVRAELRKQSRFDWAFRPEPAPFLQVGDRQPKNPLGLLRIFATPTLLAIPALGAAIGFALLYFGWLAADDDGAAAALVKVGVALGLSVLFVAMLIGLAGLMLFLALRRKEKSDVPEDRAPDAKMVQAIMEHENRCAQNHMIAVSRMKPGFLRALALRYGFFVIARHAELFYRPGFMQVIGTIHSARWIKIPHTETLVFTANYAGSWESYLEDS